MTCILTGNNYRSLFGEIIKFDHMICHVSIASLLSYTRNRINSSRKLELQFSEKTYFRSINYTVLHRAPWSIDVFSSMSLEI